MALLFRQLEIADVLAIQSDAYRDARGEFRELYRQSVAAAHGIRTPFVQENLSVSHRHVLRGLHYQLAPAAQAKLIVAVTGVIWDAAVDLRRGSPTYGRWVGLTLQPDGPAQMMYLPAGFAHGFCVLSDSATVLYKVSAEYRPDLERGIRWNDPTLKIAWPIASPILNARDASLPLWHDAQHNFD